jgi:CHAT domain-containing protein
MAAGARSVLASLWRVDDDSTKYLMINFYKEYLQHGNKGIALQNAMKQTRLRYPEPRYWAAFSLFGMAE